MSELRNAIDAAVQQYGSLNKAARVLRIDVGYLSRLRHGLLDNPSPKIQRKLGVRRRVIYERVTP